MKKFLSIKLLTNTLSISDRELYKEALRDDTKRIQFLSIIGEILTFYNETAEIAELLDQMIYILYQKAIVKATILGKIEYSEKNYLSKIVESKTIEEIAHGKFLTELGYIP